MTVRKRCWGTGQGAGQRKQSYSKFGDKKFWRHSFQQGLISLVENDKQSEFSVKSTENVEHRQCVSRHLEPELIFKEDNH